MENIINLFYRVRWWFLVVTNKFQMRPANTKFTLSKEWDFTHTDFGLLDAATVPVGMWVILLAFAGIFAVVLYKRRSIVA